jgi:hypothetical protein
VISSNRPDSKAGNQKRRTRDVHLLCTKTEDIGTNMNLEKKEEARLSCEKCGIEVSTKEASRAILADGQIHVFCTDCARNVLIFKDGSFVL